VACGTCSSPGPAPITVVDLARSGAAGTADESLEDGLAGGPAAAFLCACYAPVRACTAPVIHRLRRSARPELSGASRTPSSPRSMTRRLEDIRRCHRLPARPTFGARREGIWTRHVTSAVGRAVVLRRKEPAPSPSRSVRFPRAVYVGRLSPGQLLIEGTSQVKMREPTLGSSSMMWATSSLAALKIPTSADRLSSVTTDVGEQSLARRASTVFPTRCRLRGLVPLRCGLQQHDGVGLGVGQHLVHELVGDGFHAHVARRVGSPA
jgi:hypothetical protein